MTAIRYLCLLAPVLLLVIACKLAPRDGLRRRDEYGAALLAFIAAFIGLAALQEVNRLAGWYTFAPVDGSFRGVPVDLWLGWSMLWGPIPVLARRIAPLPITLGVLFWLDAILMPALSPLLRLESSWLIGDALGLLLIALPAQLLGRWTADRRRLTGRVLLQLGVFSALVMWFVPTVAFELGDGSWQRLLDLPTTWLLVAAQVALLAATPALLAMREFLVRGQGTPYPWDPPRRLVTTGPYAYLANPMQVSAVALLLLMALLTGSITIAVAALSAAAFSAGVAAPHERQDLIRRYGTSWRDYRTQVRDWLPRWTPYQPKTAQPSILWLDADCGPCSATRDFLARRGLVGLTLAPAADSAEPLWRAGYAGGDGHTERGVAAVARALEHVNLGWAYVGWLLRLPGVTWLAQLVVDALIAPPHLSGPGAANPHVEPARGARCPAPSNDCSTAHSRRSVNTASQASLPAPSLPLPG